MPNASLEKSVDAAGVQETLLTSGYRVQLQRGPHETLLVRAPDGQLCLTIQFTDQGPILAVSGVTLSIATSGPMTVECEKLSIHSRQGVDIHSDKNIQLTANEHLSTSAFEQSHIATYGDIQLKANDDVRIDGERIRLNSPRGEF